MKKVEIILSLLERFFCFALAMQPVLVAHCLLCQQIQAGMGHSQLMQWLRRLCNRAGVDRFGFHGIRHLSASILAEKAAYWPTFNTISGTAIFPRRRRTSIKKTVRGERAGRAKGC